MKRLFLRRQSHLSEQVLLIVNKYYCKLFFHPNGPPWPLYFQGPMRDKHNQLLLQLLSIRGSYFVCFSHHIWPLEVANVHVSFFVRWVLVEPSNHSFPCRPVHRCFSSLSSTCDVDESWEGPWEPAKNVIHYLKTRETGRTIISLGCSFTLQR